MVSSDEGQHPGIQAEHELRRANEEWVRALAQRDGAALDHIISDDFVLAFPFEGDEKAEFITDVLSGDVRVDSLEPQGVTFRAFAGAGIVFGTETANWHYKGRDLSGTYRFLRVYTKEENRWRIVALHLCSPTHRLA